MYIRDGAGQSAAGLLLPDEKQTPPQVDTAVRPTPGKLQMISFSSEEPAAHVGGLEESALGCIVETAPSDWLN